ncbi:18891_t:CDS:2, partial [Racocetra persica]
TSNKNNFGENLNFNNFENSTATSEDSNNEQDITNNTKLEKSRTQYFREQYLQWHMERFDHKKVVYARNKNQHNIATLNFENLCLLIELQIQNSNKNIISGSANLLNSPKPTTTMKSTH